MWKNEYPRRQRTVAEMERAVDALYHLDAGCPRDIWIRVGMAAKSAGLSFDDFLSWSASGGNFAGEKDCQTFWNSIDRSGAVTAATLFQMAIAQGWVDVDTSRIRGNNGSHACVTVTSVKRIDSKFVTPAAGDYAVQVWERCIVADAADAYICLKQGNPDGLRVYPVSAPTLIICGQNVAGYLVLPCWGGTELQTLQFIPPEKGDKLNLPGASFNNGFFTVGEITDRIYICEGIGQAWAINNAMGAAAVVCFGMGRMARVAKVLRDSFPSALLVVISDRGKENQAAEIAAAVSGRWIEMPLDKPVNYDANDYGQEFGSVKLADLLRRPLAPVTRFKLLSDDELKVLPHLDWRIKKVLPETGLAAVFGGTGSGKSFLVIDMAQAIAAGRPWFGYRSKPCNVLYCAFEGEGGISGRISAYRIRHGETAANIRYLVQPFNLLESVDVGDLAQAMKANGQSTQVVILDTLNRATPGADENDSKSMGQIISAAKQLQTLVGGLVVLVHHTGKDASKGLRGHSSLFAALDAAIEVRRDGDRREWMIAKCKDGEDGASHPFELEVVELEYDQDDECISSCTVHPMQDITNLVKKTIPPKSGNQRVAWDVLGEEFRKAQNFRAEGAPATLPPGRPWIRLEDAINKTRIRLVCEPKRQTERAQRAIMGLIDRGLLRHEGGFVWLN